MDPRDFHVLAERLSLGNTPVELRTAISRSSGMAPFDLYIAKRKWRNSEADRPWLLVR